MQTTTFSVYMLDLKEVETLETKARRDLQVIGIWPPRETHE